MQPVTLGSINGSNTATWAPYAYIYTATKPVPILSFAVSASGVTYIYLDDVSVVDTASSSVQLLTNPGFENSSTALIGWGVWCSSNCGTGGAIYTGGNCHGGSGSCYKDQCSLTSSDYLIQPFPAVVNRTYNISFWYYRLKSGGAPTQTYFYVGII